MSPRALSGRPFAPMPLLVFTTSFQLLRSFHLLSGPPTTPVPPPASRSSGSRVSRPTMLTPFTCLLLRPGPVFGRTAP